MTNVESAMQQQKYVSKKKAPLQYFFRNFNSDAGKVLPGWGTTPFMFVLMLLFLVFLLMILQIANATLLLRGVDVGW